MSEQCSHELARAAGGEDGGACPDHLQAVAGVVGDGAQAGRSRIGAGGDEVDGEAALEEADAVVAGDGVGEGPLEFGAGGVSPGVVDAWRGVAAPKGLPDDVRRKLEAAVKTVYDSKDYQDFMSQRGFGVIWGNGEEFAKFMARGDADMKKVMTAVGIAK